MTSKDPMRFFPYELPAKDKEPSVFALVTAAGMFACIFDGRAVVFPFPTPSVYDPRKSLINTLQSRHRIHEVLRDQPNYSAKYTLQAVHNRLRELVLRGTISEATRMSELATIVGKCHDLVNEHEWDRYLSVSTVAKSHLGHCVRLSGDFENDIIPRLIPVIEAELRAEGSGSGFPLAKVPGSLPACSRLAGFLQSVQWKAQSPYDVNTTATEMVSWATSAVEEIKQLKSSLSKQRVGVPEAETTLRSTLEARGIPCPTGFTLFELAKTMTQYLVDVEVHGVNMWRRLALKAIAREKTTRVLKGGVELIDSMWVTADVADRRALWARVRQERALTEVATAAGNKHRDESMTLAAEVSRLEAKVGEFSAQRTARQHEHEDDLAAERAEHAAEVASLRAEIETMRARTSSRCTTRPTRSRRHSR